MDRRDRLTGVLIGLARATFGNDDIITPDTYPKIIKGLTAVDSRVNSFFTKALMMVGTREMPVEFLLPAI